MYSLAKEEAVDEPHNVVLILSRDAAVTHRQAVDLATRMIDERMTTFLVIRDRVDELCTLLRLARAQRASVRRYVHDALETMLRAPGDWSAVSGRYRTTLDVGVGRRR